MLKVQPYCFTTLRGESYAAFFEGEPPVSYEELSASGSYLLYHGEGLPSLETEQVELKVDKTSFLTDEEYEALPEKEKEHANLNSLYDGNTGELTIFSIPIMRNIPLHFPLQHQWTFRIVRKICIAGATVCS